MQRFQRILYINDPADRVDAFLRAVGLARSNEARMTIASVCEELPPVMADLEESVQQLKAEEIRSLLRQSSTNGLELETRHLTGIPFVEIIKDVASNGYDLVIKPAEGRGGTSNTLFGSTDLHLMRKCPRPLWVIKPSKRRQYSRILAAIAPDSSDESNAELNGLILELAVSLTRRDDAELHVIHAWSVPFESELRGGRTHLPQFQVDRMVQDARDIHKGRLERFLGSYDLRDISAKVHLLKGDPGRVLPVFARTRGVDLVVMGTVARTGIPGFIIGNTAEKTLTQVDCSVLVLKPTGFLSPVEP